MKPIDYMNRRRVLEAIEEFDRYASEGGRGARVGFTLALEDFRVLKEIIDDGNRVCDNPGCLAAIIRRDDGSRVCAAGHESRYIERTDLAPLREKLEDADLTIGELNRARDACIRSVRDMTQAAADARQELDICHRVMDRFTANHDERGPIALRDRIFATLRRFGHDTSEAERDAQAIEEAERARAKILESGG